MGLQDETFRPLSARLLRASSRATASTSSRPSPASCTLFPPLPDHKGSSYEYSLLLMVLGEPVAGICVCPAAKDITKFLLL